MSGHEQLPAPDFTLQRLKHVLRNVREDVSTGRETAVQTIQTSPEERVNTIIANVTVDFAGDTITMRAKCHKVLEIDACTAAMAVECFDLWTIVLSPDATEVSWAYAREYTDEQDRESETDLISTSSNHYQAGQEIRGEDHEVLERFLTVITGHEAWEVVAPQPSDPAT